jgi:hypothetical protein
MTDPSRNPASGPDPVPNAAANSNSTPVNPQPLDATTTASKEGKPKRRFSGLKNAFIKLPWRTGTSAQKTAYGEMMASLHPDTHIGLMKAMERMVERSDTESGDSGAHVSVEEGALAPGQVGVSKWWFSELFDDAVLEKVRFLAFSFLLL